MSKQKKLMGKYYYRREATLGQRIDKVWEIEEIKLLIAKKSFFAFNGELERELDELWVAEPENKATAQYGRNWGFYIGLDNIRKAYAAAPAEIGYCSFRPMSTPVLHIAADKETAYGLWYSLAYDAKDVGAGMRGYQLFDRCFFDFKKENGAWKIWHMFIGNDNYAETGFDQSTEPGNAIAEGHPVNPVQVEFGTPMYPMDAYDPKWSWCHFPVIPHPHDSYDVRVSCSIEGFMNYKSSRMDLDTVYNALGGYMK